MKRSLVVASCNWQIETPVSHWFLCYSLNGEMVLSCGKKLQKIMWYKFHLLYCNLFFSPFRVCLDNLKLRKKSEMERNEMNRNQINFSFHCLKILWWSETKLLFDRLDNECTKMNYNYFFPFNSYLKKVFFGI